MKKIFINKNDDPAKVVEKVLESKERDVVLVIPKSSKLTASVANFHLIKREASADDKNILIESVDDEALALAKASKLPGINPFLTMHKKSMSDIVSPDRINTNVEEDTEEGKDIEEKVAKLESEVDFTKKDQIRKSKKLFLPKIKHMKGLIATIAIIIPVFAVAAITTAPKVTISLNVEEYPWQFEDQISAVSNIENIDLTANVLPGEIFTEKKNLTMEFDTSGEKKVERRSTGVVLIYNAFSSKEQPLVATTRLLTPDGKLYRLVNSITVPGAEIVDGEIVPSSIKTEVVSDKPGEEYNIGPIERFSIPGFQGTSKYKGFYASSDSNMEGGFVGIVSFPTEKDSLKAKEEVKNKLIASLKAFNELNIPEGFIFLEDASDISIDKIEIVEEINNNGKFKVYGEGTLQTIAFPKAELLTLLQNKASGQIGFDVELEENKLSFAEITPNISEGKLAFKANWNGVAVKKIDNQKIKEDIKNKDSEDLKNYITSLDGVASAKISFWPFWVKESPDNTSKINIETTR